MSTAQEAALELEQMSLSNAARRPIAPQPIQAEALNLTLLPPPTAAAIKVSVILCFRVYFYLQVWLTENKIVKIK